MFATEVSDVLLHGMLGNTAGPLVQLMPSLLQASDDVWKQIGETCSMYAEIAVTEDTALPFTRDVDAAVFRILQLRIASELGAEKVSAIAERALEEARGRVGAAELRVRYFDFLFLWQYLTQAKNDMPLRRVVELSLKFIRLSAELGAEFRDAHDLADPEAEQQWPDLSPFLKLILFPAIVDVTTLKELLDIIGELVGDDRALIVGAYADDDDGAAFTLDRIWLAEARLASPDWKSFATTLERVLAVAGDHQIDSLADAAAAMVVRVIDENVEDHDGVLERADSLIDEMGRLPRLLAAKATALTRAERPADAIPLYSEALDRFPLGPPWLTDAYGAAAIAAARAGQWDRNVGWFGEAVSSLDDAEPLARRAGLEFDRGLALHKAGRTPAAVQAFGRAVGMHVESGEEVPTEPLLSARQMGSHAIKLLLNERNGRPMESDQPVFPEFVGRCSSLETLNWGSQKAADLDVVIASLAELDLLVDPNAAVTIGLAERLRETKSALAGVAAGQILLRLAVRTLDVRSIVKDALRQLRFLSSATSARAEGSDVAELRLDPRDEPIAPENVILIAHAIVAAATAMVGAGRGRLLPFAEWRGDLPLDASFDELRVDLDDARGVFQGDAYIWPRVVGGNATWVQHVMAALAFLSRGRSTPDELLIAQAVAAGYLDQGFLRDLVCDPVSAMVTDTWLAACDSPAQLVSPRFSVPAIRSAVTGTQSGWARVKAVLEAAASAVSAGTARNIRSRVDRIRS